LHQNHYVYAGSYVQTINGKQVILKKGEFCLLDTNVVHTIEAAGEGDIIINCMMRKNYFDSDLLRRLQGNHLISEFIINAIYKNKEYNQYILFHSGESVKIKHIMNEILCEYFDPGICSIEIINSYVMILFSELLRIYKATNETNKSLSVEKVLITDILLYLEQNYSSVTLTSAAQYFRFHPNYLSRLLKNHIGMSFIKIVQDLKLKKACSILENTQVPIAKVAQEVGISNMNTFYELFQSGFGLTPREYRLIKQKNG
jgi:YesN/AraC family two-component response regulator